ncbi:MAG: hypothetical protein FJ098_00715 [Deltaproteobacteria bacterium]|nr:hypothetical protein [Deltaproteobacteria bacterium]
MSNEIRARLGALYVDGLRYVTPVPSGAVINTIPAEGETDVSVSIPVKLTVVSFIGALSNVCQVWLTRLSDGLRILAYDLAAGGFQGPFTGTAVLRASPLSGVNDELALEIVPPIPFTSLDTIIVDVSFEVVGGGAENPIQVSYRFTIEDITAPELEEIFWIEPTLARVKFDEVVSQSASPGGSLFYQHALGGVEVLSANQVLVSGLTLSSSWIGCWLGLAGSCYPWNNGYRKITGVSPSTKILTLDTTGDRGEMTPDDGRDLTDDGKLFRRRNLRVGISSFRIRARLDQEQIGKTNLDPLRIQCAYEPVIVEVRTVPAVELPSGADPRQYVYLEVHDLISFGRKYTLDGVKVEDAWGNAMADDALDFTSPSWGIPGSRLGFWSSGIIAPRDPQWDMEHSGELRRICVVLQDALNCLLWHNQVIENLLEPHRCPEDWLQHWVYTSGNPFRFSLDDQRTLRKLPLALPKLYKKVGLASAIKEMIFTVLGIHVEIRVYVTSSQWTLNNPTWSVLGYTTVLGPSTAFHRNCYEIVSPIDLTVNQRNIIRQIAEWADPMNMHLLRLVEPSMLVPGAPVIPVYWILGVSLLGEGTILS